MFKKAKRYVAAAILAATPLFTLLAPSIAHAATFTCTWTGGGTDSKFSTAANWSGCNSAAPLTSDADDLVFPTTVTNLSPVNDLTGATFSSITINGTGGSGPYDIAGNSFTLAGDFTDASDQFNDIENDISISGATTVDIHASAGPSFTGNISGAGSITKTGSGVVSFGTLGITGTITVSDGQFQVVPTSGASVTYSSVTVGTSGTFSFNAFDNSALTSYNFTADLTLNGGTADLQVAGSGPYTLDLNGALTLGADSNMFASSGETVNVLGAYTTNSHVLSTAGNVVLPSSSTSGGGGSSTPTGTTPGTPDTGFALVATHPGVTLLITLASAGTIFAIARKTAAARR